MSKTDIEIIDEVIETIGHSRTTWELAYDAKKNQVHPNDPSACSWCLLGAFAKAQPDVYKYNPSIDPLLNDISSFVYAEASADLLIEKFANYLTQEWKSGSLKELNSFIDRVWQFNDVEAEQEDVVYMLKKFRKQLEKNA